MKPPFRQLRSALEPARRIPWFTALNTSARLPDTPRTRDDPGEIARTRRSAAR